jgi:hypothetical protein
VPNFTLFATEANSSSTADTTSRLAPLAARCSGRVELKAAADRLAKALADVDQEELVAELKEMPARQGRSPLR